MSFKQDLEKRVFLALDQMISSQADTNAESSIDIRSIEFLIEVPNLPSHGDYSTNVALLLSKVLKKSPFAVANEFIPLFKKPDYIKDVQVAKPGFVNFFVDRQYLARSVLCSSSLNENATTPAKKFKLAQTSPKYSDRSKTKVIVEHTSVNPNKAMHVGHLRNAILGDSIARLLKSAGYKVEVQNYIDDTGIQVADTTNAVLNLNVPQKKEQEFDDYCWNIYAQINKSYETNKKLKKLRENVLHSIESGTDEVAKKSKEIVEKIVQHHLYELTRLGIRYDLLAYESSIIQEHLWDKAFEKLKESENFVFSSEGETKGCWILKYKGSGGDKIFVRSNGTVVYTAKDTAYHLWKFGLLNKDFTYEKLDYNFLKEASFETYRTKVGSTSEEFGGGDMVVNIIDERQTYAQDMVKLALESLGYSPQAEQYHHIAYGVVNLSKKTAQQLGVDVTNEQETYTMSGRKGIGVKSKDIYKLLVSKILERNDSLENREVSKGQNAIQSKATADDIAVGALRLYMLKNNYLTHVVFDFEDALSTEGFTGPYLQYSHARAKSIMRKVSASDVSDVKDLKKTIFSNAHMPNLHKEAREATESTESTEANEINDYEFSLLKKINEWHDVFEQSVDELKISSIADYTFKLCSDFNSFYHACPILDVPQGLKEYRLGIVQVYLRVLRDCLYILGIPAPERM